MCFGVFTLHSAPYGADNSVGEGYKHRAPPEQGPKQQNRSFSGKATYTGFARIVVFARNVEVLHE